MMQPRIYLYAFALLYLVLFGCTSCDNPVGASGRVCATETVRPLVGVLVEVVYMGLKDTTDAEGKFAVHQLYGYRSDALTLLIERRTWSP